MNQKELIIYLLGKFGGNKTRSDLTNLWYEYFPELIDKIRIRYLDLTEKGLFNRISSWVASYPHHYPDIFISDRIDNKLHYSLTEFGLSLYNELLIKIDTEEEIKIEKDVDDVTDNIEDIIEDNVGIVYLLISKRYPNTYKIGITSRTIEDRLNELTRDRLYGIFNLEVKMYIKCIDFSLIERVLHKFFEDFRMGTSVNKSSTELFVDNPTIEDEFELFVKMLQENPRYKTKIKELIKL